jgi:hypothetical protein
MDYTCLAIAQEAHRGIEPATGLLGWDLSARCHVIDRLREILRQLMQEITG